MIDSLVNKTSLISSAIIEHQEKINWQPYFLLVASLSLIAAVTIPFAQKKYDEYRTKRSFKIYLKKQLGFIFNFLTCEKLDYHEPSIKSNPQKEQLDLIVFIERFESDLKNHKTSVQPMIIFTLIMNLQTLLLSSFQLRLVIKNLDFKDLMRLTLEHGSKLSKKELSNIYGLIVVLESFVSISLYHDRFSDMKSIKRLVQENVWVGLKLDGDFLKKQEVLNSDLQFINDNESSIREIFFVLKAVNQEINKYFDYKQ